MICLKTVFGAVDQCAYFCVQHPFCLVRLSSQSDLFLYRHLPGRLSRLV